MLHRIALGLEYDGSDFSGWQHQSHAPSIQSALNRAISAVADHPVHSTAAGRTDAGVHACGQVVHFDSAAERTERSWERGINSHLPASVRVLWARPVPPEFHARYSALSRTYRYLILNRPEPSALERNRAWWYRLPLDAAVMHNAAQQLLGEHDFSAFRGAGCQARSPRRRMEEISVASRSGYLVVTCRANGFLHHMVRNLVGSLARIACGDAPAGWLGEVLVGRDRRLAAPTAPARGLYLSEVCYPREYALPVPAPLPLWSDR